jgi:hypothetical protein
LFPRRAGPASELMTTRPKAGIGDLARYFALLNSRPLPSGVWTATLQHSFLWGRGKKRRESSRLSAARQRLGRRRAALSAKAATSAIRCGSGGPIGSGIDEMPIHGFNRARDVF